MDKVLHIIKLSDRKDTVKRIVAPGDSRPDALLAGSGRVYVIQDLKILVIAGEPPRPGGIERQLKEAGYRRTETVAPEESFRRLDLLAPDATVIGPFLSPEQRHDCIRRLKIIDILAPVFVFPCAAQPEEEDSFSHFHGVERLTPDAGGREISRRIQAALAEESRNGVGDDTPVLLGRTPQMSMIRERIHRVSDKDVTVLVSGETGTGKEIIARSVHYFSNRRKGPLIKISCGNLPDHLLESEVFGFQKGAFTDAHRNKPGRLELADNGTLFLDEVGDLSLPLQVKFLQIFEDRSFSRLGAVDEKVVDARVVAATHFDLSKKVKTGEFRRDLFYRLNVVHIRTVPLRERKEDIPQLARYFLRKYCSLLKREPVELPGAVLGQFYAYHWPGNVRELENLVKRGIVLRSWEFVEQEFRLASTRNVPPRPAEPAPPPGPLTAAEHPVSGGSSLREITRAYVSGVERKAILEVLDSVRWNRRRAAQLLGVSYKTVCNRIKELGIGPQ